MEKPWLDSYPPHVPPQIPPSAAASLGDLMAPVCAAWPERTAFFNQGTGISFQRFDELSRAFSSWLQHGAGLRPGERVALMLPNLLQYPVALFGVLGAGCVVVNINPLYTARELQQQLVDSGASCIVVLENFAHLVQQVLPATALRSVITTRVGDLLHQPRALLTNFIVAHVKHMVPDWQIDGALDLNYALHRGASLEPAQAAPRGADPAMLQYTGGTTGVPKGAILTHANLVANVLQTQAWVGGALVPGHETAIIPLPLYHIFALTCMLTFMRLGATNVLITNPRDLPGLIKEIKHVRPTAIIAVNTLLRALLDAPDVAEADTGTLKLTVAGGMAVQRSVAERWEKTFKVPVIEGYGLTETSPIVCANRLDAGQFTGTVGLPLPSTEVAILDEFGEPLAPGNTGEIGVRGPQVMQGYWQHPDETARAFSPDGYLLTGDMGTMDSHGFVTLLDRKKDMINVSGLKVFPNEVEEVATMHPKVLEAAAVGVPDETAGEAVRLVVVPRDGQLSQTELREHLVHNLAPYKVPKYIEISDQPLPKSHIGKVLRRLVVSAPPRT